VTGSTTPLNDKRVERGTVEVPAPLTLEFLDGTLDRAGPVRPAAGRLDTAARSTTSTKPAPSGCGHEASDRQPPSMVSSPLLVAVDLTV
jgi:hypothetical protein